MQSQFIFPSTYKASSHGLFCMKGIYLGGAVTLRQSWPIKFVTANTAVRAERNGKCAVRACRCVSEEGREDSGSLGDRAARNIYSAARVHTWTQTVNPPGTLIGALNCTVNDEVVSKKEKKHTQKKKTRPSVHFTLYMKLQCS